MSIGPRHPKRLVVAVLYTFIGLCPRNVKWLSCLSEKAIQHSD